MSRNGGYKIIDLKNASITIGGAAVKVEGIYDAIEHNYGKPTLLSGVVLDGIERPDRYVAFGVSAGNFVALMGISADVELLYINVTPDDMVTFTIY